jgi:predicted nucleotidyltransferase
MEKDFLTDKDVSYVYSRLRKHKDFLFNVEKFDPKKILGIFAVGSMNYGLFTENSDVDSIAIYVPSASEGFFNPHPYSKEFVIDGEHCTVRDIRLILDNWQNKPGIETLQILTTRCYLFNSKYEDVWNYILERKDLIGKANLNKLIHATYWAHDQYYHRYFFKPSNKLYANTLRLENSFYYLMSNPTSFSLYEFINHNNLRSRVVKLGWVNWSDNKLRNDKEDLDKKHEKCPEYEADFSVFEDIREYLYSFIHVKHFC